MSRPYMLSGSNTQGLSLFLWQNTCEDLDKWSVQPTRPTVLFREHHGSRKASSSVAKTTKRRIGAAKFPLFVLWKVS